MIDPPAPSRGEWPDDSRADEAGRGSLLAGRYELGKELGRGGMGRVYRAHDRLLGREVAVKILAADDQADGEFAQACAREARAAARLVHPGIVTVHDIGVQDEQSFLVMELIPGPTLRELLLRGPLAPAQAIDIAAQVADALDYAHRHGVLHCDVKPHNIIMRVEADGEPGEPVPVGRPTLVDFGIARAASSTRTFTATATVSGTAAYMAPEQLLGESLDGRTDVYALGAVLFEMLAGRPPYEGPNVAAIVARRLATDPPPLRSLAPNVADDLEEAVRTGLRREPARRYATAGRFRDVLRQVQATSAGPVEATASAPRPVGLPMTIRVRPVPHGRADGVEPRKRRAFGAGAVPAGRGDRGAVSARPRRLGNGFARLVARPRLGLVLAAIIALLGLALVVASAPGRPTAPSVASESAGSSTEPAATSAPIALTVIATPVPTALAATLVPTVPAPPAAAATTDPNVTLPGTGWATFTRQSCEWSDATTERGVCFGLREAGYRVRVVERRGSRWQIWDPQTGDTAYVNVNALQLD